MRSDMEEWKEVRQQVLANGMSKRAACAKYKLGWHTLNKILAHAEPPGYRQQAARPKRVLASVLPIIHEILATDGKAPKKQRHTAKRIFERLKLEYGYLGGKTVVEDAVRAWRQTHQEVFLPLSHPPGEAQVDFGEATIRQGGVERKVALFVMTLPYSGAIFIQAFPRECTETFLEGHRRAFEFFGGVPHRISYDNSAIAVIEVLSPKNKRKGDGRVAYEAKRQKILDSASHLVEIDLLRDGDRIPMGRPRPPVTDYYVLISKEDRRPKTSIWAFTMQEPLPVLPIPLGRDYADVPLDLKSCLDRVYDEGRYGTAVNYARLPNPELDAIRATWANDLLAKRRDEHHRE